MYIHSHVKCDYRVFMSACVRKYIHIYMYIHTYYIYTHKQTYRYKNRTKIFRDSTSEFFSITSDTKNSRSMSNYDLSILCLFSVPPPAPCIEFGIIRGILTPSTGLASEGFLQFMRRVFAGAIPQPGFG